jgi:hypothetical protein
MRRITFIIALAALVSASVPPAFAQDMTPVAVIAEPASADKLEAFLRGTWLVTVSGQQRTRQMVVRDTKPDGNRFAIGSFYGWSDTTPTPVSAAARIENGIVMFDLTTGANGQIQARSTADNRLDGTFKNPDGRVNPVSLERMSTSTELRRVSNSPTAILGTAAAPKAVDLEELLYGSWLVTVGREVRTRTMEIRTVQEEGGKFVAETVYGWTDGNPRPAPMTVGVENGIVSLDLVTSAKARIVAKSVAPDRFVGTFTLPDGKEQAVRLMLTGNEIRAVEQSARIKDLTFVYVGAENCGPCKRWEQSRTGSPAQSKSVFLASPEAKAATFRQVNAHTYMNTGAENLWPADLKWVRSATHVVSGTPRFLLIADGKVMLNAQGTSKIESTVLPKLRELAAKKG